MTTAKPRGPPGIRRWEPSLCGDNAEQGNGGSMTEVFRRYGDGDPQGRDHVETIACVVRHPDAGGQCEREAVGEVWALPFCEVHGHEAELAYKTDLAETVDTELEALRGAEAVRVGTDRALLEALQACPDPAHVGYGVHKAAMEAAYPPEELADNMDPDIPRFEFGSPAGDTPYDWWCESRELLVRFMRQATSVPIIKELELVRERATVQELLAERDMDRRCGPSFARV